jgi:hypothetical protein
MGDKLVTTMSGRTFYEVIDDDTMATADSDNIPTGESVKAYVDAREAAAETSATTAAVAEARANVQELTASGAVTPGVNSVELNHISAAIEATIADLAAHPGLFVVKNTSASGSAAHTVTLTAGTWNGTNDVITLDAGKECIAFWVDSDGNGTVLENVGTVGLSTAGG